MSAVTDAAAMSESRERWCWLVCVCVCVMGTENTQEHRVRVGAPLSAKLGWPARRGVQSTVRHASRSMRTVGEYEFLNTHAWWQFG